MYFCLTWLTSIASKDFNPCFITMLIKRYLYKGLLKCRKNLCAQHLNKQCSVGLDAQVKRKVKVFSVDSKLPFKFTLIKIVVKVKLPSFIYLLNILIVIKCLFMTWQETTHVQFWFIRLFNVFVVFFSIRNSKSHTM